MLTFVTRQRAALFADAALVAVVQEALTRACLKHEFELQAYCFLPDHLHLLVSGSGESNLTSFVRLFKQLSGYEAKQRFGRSLWQISYYDHVLRTEEGAARVRRYIWDNPVRAGLVDQASDYAYSGPKPLLE